jgi:hypothetical protein
MKRGFIRGLWGIFDSTNRFTNRRFSVAKDIENIIINKFNEPFRTYVMGRENYELVLKSGIKDAVLIDEIPFRFDLKKYQYRNKIEIIMNAMENDGFDESVYLDWDCVPQKAIPINFWEEMGKKEVFQANLQCYHRRKCCWRQSNIRAVPNGGFLYIRDKMLPRMAAQKWEELGRGDNDEPSWAKVTDDMIGGWQGKEKYWELFESMFSNLHRGSYFDQSYLNKKENVCFIHFQGN